jgi:hypothetical protein
MKEMKGRKRREKDETRIERDAAKKENQETK